MLENHAHPQRVGVDLQQPQRTDWPAVYRRVGGYEGSKLQAHFKVLECMQALGGELATELPATVRGHSQSGHILPAQPLAELISNLATGKLSAIPGMLAVLAEPLKLEAPRHFMPISLLRWLLKIPGLAKLQSTSPESLDFIQTTRFDTRTTKALALKYQLQWPDINQAMQATVAYVLPAHGVRH
jgi:dihydroflavonol-4-reductase